MLLSKCLDETPLRCYESHPKPALNHKKITWEKHKIPTPGDSNAIVGLGVRTGEGIFSEYPSDDSRYHINFENPALEAMTKNFQKNHRPVSFVEKSQISCILTFTNKDIWGTLL